MEPLLVPIDELVPHEETLPRRAERVAASIAALRRVMRPIIVEEKTMVIMDGHHRYEALRRLGARLAPVVPASYSRDIDRVDAATRILTVRAGGPHEALQAAAEMLEARAPGRGLRLRLQAGGEELVVTLDPLLGHHAAASLHGSVAGRGPRRYTVRILAEPPRPRDIVGEALRGNRYPPRTTLHRTALKSLEAPVPARLLLP